MARPLLANGPVLSVQDWKDYNAWKDNARVAEDVPLATIMLLGSSAPLFAVDENAGPVVDGVPTGIPWLMRLRCELPTRDLRADGTEFPVKAAYIGFGTDDNKDFYEMFVGAMEQVGIAQSDCCQIHTTPSDDEKSHLEASDVILIGGGDPYKTWRVLEDTYVGEQIRWRYYDGAVIIGVGEGAMLLGQKAWAKVNRGGNKKQDVDKDENQYHVFKTFEMVPTLVSPDFGRHSEALEAMIGEQPTGGRIVGLPKFGAVLFNRDGTLEPAWATTATEIRRAYDEAPGEIHRAIFLPPPRNLGSMVAMERYQQQLRDAQKKRSQQGECDGDGDGDGENDEDVERDMEREWLASIAPWRLRSEGADTELPLEAAKLKGEGNQAFKKKDWVRAARCYDSALQLEACDTSLHLNLAAALLKQADSQQALEEENAGAAEGETDEGAGEGAGGAGGSSGENLARRRYLQQAWEAANVALHITGGRSAKAWYRRGRASASLHNFVSAVYDAEEALALEPGSVETKRLLALWKEQLQKSKEDAYWEHKRAVAGQIEALSLGRSTVLDLTSEHLLPAALWAWQDLLKRNAVLVKLTVSTRIGVEGCRFLSEGLRANCTLQTLLLRDCAVRPEGAKCLSNALRQNSTLLKLDLSGNCLRDKGLRILFEEGLPHNSTLASLVLASNHATDACAFAVANYLYGKRGWSRRSPSAAGAGAGNTPGQLYRFDESIRLGTGNDDDDDNDDDVGGGCSLARIDLSFNRFGAVLARELSRRVLTLREGDAATRDAHPLEHISLRCNTLRSGSVVRLVSVFCAVAVLSSLDLSGMGTRKRIVRDLEERLRYKRVQVDFDPECPKSGSVASAGNFGLPLLDTF